jgi:hypothetical protein
MVAEFITTIGVEKTITDTVSDFEQPCAEYPVTV